jgi:hypothetical protein
MTTNVKPKKLAFCITCMNRLQHLQQTLEKNILDNYLIDTDCRQPTKKHYPFHKK